MECVKLFVRGGETTTDLIDGSDNFLKKQG